MSDEHKAALARGRVQGVAVRRYLEALEQQAPRRGRKRSIEKMQAGIQALEAKMDNAPVLDKLNLAQQRLDLEAEVDRQLLAEASAPSMAELEQAFIEHAGGYSVNKGITYQAWRSVGVKPDVLRRAGIRP